MSEIQLALYEIEFNDLSVCLLIALCLLVFVSIKLISVCTCVCYCYNKHYLIVLDLLIEAILTSLCVSVWLRLYVCVCLCECVCAHLCFAGPSDSAAHSGHSGDTAAVVVPVLFVLLLCVCGGLVALYMRHRRLQHSFTAFANSHYNSRLGSAIFSSGDELGKSTTHSAHTYPLTYKTGFYRLSQLTESITFIYYNYILHRFNISNFGLSFVFTQLLMSCLFFLQKATTTRMTL